MSFKPFRCFPGPRAMANKLSSLFTRDSMCVERGAMSSGVHIRHFFVHLCTGSLSPGAVHGCIGSNNIVYEFPNGLLVLAVGLEAIHGVENPSEERSCSPYLLEVGAIVARGEPRRLGVRNQ